MTEENKIKIEVEKLKDRKKDLQFEINRQDLFFIGILASIIAVIIPPMISIGIWYYQLMLGGVLLILINVVHRKISPLTRRNLEELKCINCKLNEKYGQLLK